MANAGIRQLLQREPHQYTCSRKRTLNSVKKISWWGCGSIWYTLATICKADVQASELAWSDRRSVLELDQAAVGDETGPGLPRPSSVCACDSAETVRLLDSWTAGLLDCWT